VTNLLTLEGGLTMPTKWTLNAAGGGGNSAELVGCHIAVVGTAYQFQNPSGTSQSTTDVNATSLPTPPFDFPVFTSALAGTTSATWYIRVDTLTDGQSHNKGKGKWSPNPFPTPPGPADTDPDNWTTQAGVGIQPEGDQGEDEDNDKAASASPRL
jgi:hypothetical protein